MSIVVVGGHECMSDEYKGIGKKLGCRVKVFCHASARFGKSIGEPDAMVLFTSTVSHQMVHTAMKEAKRKKIPFLRCHSSSGAALEDALKTLTCRHCGQCGAEVCS